MLKKVKVKILKSNGSTLTVGDIYEGDLDRKENVLLIEEFTFSTPSHYKIWHTTATCGTFGAAVAAGKLLIKVKSRSGS